MRTRRRASGTTVVVLLLLAAPAFGQSPRLQSQSAAETTADQLKQRLDLGEKVLIIDVREDDEVKSGSIPGAIQIRMSELEERLQDIPKNIQLVFT